MKPEFKFILTCNLKGRKTPEKNRTNFQQQIYRKEKYVSGRYAVFLSRKEWRENLFLMLYRTVCQIFILWMGDIQGAEEKLGQFLDRDI